MTRYSGKLICKRYEFLFGVDDMVKKRQGFSLDDLVAVSKNGVKRFVRYDEGRMLYSMGRNRFAKSEYVTIILVFVPYFIGN